MYDQQIRCILKHRNRKLNHYNFPTERVQLHRVCHAEMDACPYQRSEFSTQPLSSTATSRPPCVSTITDEPKQPKMRDGAGSSLDVAIGLVNIGEEASTMTPVPAIFGVATALLTTIRVSLIPLCGRNVAGSNLVRTRWRTTRNVWISGYSAPMSVMRLGGERAQGGKRSSVSRCATR